MIVVYGERGALGTIALDDDQLRGSNTALQEVADQVRRRTGSAQAAYKALAGKVNGYLSFIDTPDHDGSQNGVLHAYDRHGALGSVILDRGRVRTSESGLEGVVRSFVKRATTPAAAFKAMSGWSNGYLWFVPADHDVKLAAFVSTYKRTEHGRTQIVRSYDRTVEPTHWISPEKWAQGQMEWIKHGERAFEAHPYKVTYDGTAGAPFLFEKEGGKPFHVSERFMYGVLSSYAPRQDDDTEPPLSDVGRGSVASRQLRGKVEAAASADLDKDQPESGFQAATSVRNMSDGSKVVVKVGEDQDSMDREELSAYVGQALSAGAPMVARGKDRTGPMIEEFSPGTVLSRYVDPDKQLTREEFLRAARPVYDRGLWTIGLLDWLISNYDRNAGNVIVRDDGTPMPIDHGFVGFDQHAVLELGDSVNHSPFLDVDRLKREMTPARFAEISAQLAKVRPEFVRLHHVDWYDSMIEQLDKLKPAGYEPPHVGAAVHKAAGTPKLDAREAQALWYYTSGPGASMVLNGSLRNGEDAGPLVDGLDSAIAKATPLDKQAVVYRAGIFPRELKPGDTFTDKGFVSTSVAEDFSARNFTLAPDRTGNSRLPLARIVLPPGLKVLSVPNQADHTHNFEEGEVILPRGLTFRVTGRTRYQFHMAYSHEPIEVPVIEMEVVPSG